MVWWIPWVIAAAATVASINSQRKARKERRRAAEVERRRRAIESRRANIQNVEQGRRTIGAVENVAAQTGGAGGSAALGTVASLQTQTAANINFNNQLLTFAERTERHLEKASLYDWQSQSFTAIANLSSSTAGNTKIWGS